MNTDQHRQEFGRHNADFILSSVIASRDQRRGDPKNGEKIGGLWIATRP